MNRTNAHTPLASGASGFRRVLLITAFPPNPVGGALVEQLLRGYPPESLFWWVSAPPVDHACAPAAHLVHFPIPAWLAGQRRLSTLKSWMVEALWVPRAAEHLRQFAAAVRPDVVWCQLTGWAIAAFERSNLIASHQCHVSLWDYHDSCNHQRQLGVRRARRLARATESLVRRATSWDAVSHPMRDDLAQRTGRDDGIIVHSGFEPAQVQWLRGCEPDPISPIRIAYAGSIIAPDTFRLFVRTLAELRPRLSRPLTLELFSRSFQGEPWFDSQWMHDHGLLNEPEFVEQLRRCTWGFAPMNLTDADPAYNRYSFPNKFGTYLSAGLPLIVLAHAESSAAKMLRAHPVGVFSDALDPQVLASVLRPALDEPNPKRRFKREILRCAESEFDGAQMRRALWERWGVRPA